MNSKTAYTLCTSSSHRTSEKLPSAFFDGDVAKRLYLAQQKLRPIIEEVMGTTIGHSSVKLLNRSHYLTVEQYENAVWATQVLKEVDQIIYGKQNGKCLKKPYNLNNFNLEKNNVKVNKFGKIFVDTLILIQLIELHRTLGNIINNVRESKAESNFSNDVSSYTQTEHSNNTSEKCDSCEGKDFLSDDKFNVIVVENSKPKIKINVLSCKNNNYNEQNEGKKINGKVTQELPSCAYLKSFVILSAHTIQSDKNEKEELNTTNPKKNLSTLPEERTSNLDDSRPSSRRTKSTGSINSVDQNSKVTDVVGARKIILNCLHDLKRVRSFLERVDIGVSAEVQIQSAVFDINNDVETSPTQQTNMKQSQTAVNENEISKNNAENQKKFRFDSDPSPSNLHLKNKNVPIHNINENNAKISNPPRSDSKGECCCGSTYASETPMELLLDAGDENASKLIICIKGNTEEEGDVQIIIRQCSECKIVGGKELTDDMVTDGRSHNISDDKEDITRKQSKQNDIISDSTSRDEERSPRAEIPIDSLEGNEGNIPQDKEAKPEKNGLNVLFDPNDPSKSVVEPLKDMNSDKYPLESEYNDDDTNKDQLPSSDEFDHDKPGINVIFDPNDPSKSVVEAPKNMNYDTESLPVKETPAEESEKLLADQSKQKIPNARTEQAVKDSKSKIDNYSRIKLYETTNLCFSTDEGQELIISLTIRPKSGAPMPQISLKDIFSESTTGTEKTDQTQENVGKIFSSERNFTVGIQDRQQQDRFIPLSRTKICSSLEFDVSVMDSKIRNKGIKHINPGIVVRLKELGVNNLLRACRPVKCGRPAVLNEKLRKRLPYSASLTSLPLEEADTDIIDQSLNMSVNKSKHFSVKSKRKTVAYFTQLGDSTDKISFTKNMQISFLHIQRSREISYNNKTSVKNKYIKKKLGYYINLVHDVEIGCKHCTYEVFFFEIKNYNISQKIASNSLEKHKKCVKRSEHNDKLLNNSGIKKEHKLITSTYTTKNDAKIDNISTQHIIKSMDSALKIHQSQEIPISSFKHKPLRHLKYKLSADNFDLRKCDLQNASWEERKNLPSKIPIYKYNKNRCFRTKNKLTCNSDIYDISLQSLPKDDVNETKVLKTIQTKGQVELLQQNKSCRKDWNSNMATNKNNIQIISNNNPEIDCKDKTSDDSLELYFNNFFRDKYFSKLALCQNQSSNVLLKSRKKKSEYHCSRSQSQTCFSDSKLNIRHLSSPLHRMENSKRIHTFKNRTSSENKEYNENLEISKSAMHYLTRMFCEHWAKDMIMQGKKDVKEEVTNFNSISSSIDILRNEVFQKLFCNIKQRIIEEATDNNCRSQPNVEAGMDNEESSIKYCITRRVSEENSKRPIKETLLVVKDIQNFGYLRPTPKHEKIASNLRKISSDVVNNSCDNFQNVVVMFESNTSLNSVSLSSDTTDQKSSCYYLKNPLPNDSLSAVSENKEYNSNMENILEANFCIETLPYFVYHHYFRTPSLPKKVIEKSRSLFKSNCKSDRQLVTVEYINSNSLLSLKGKESKICGCAILSCQSKTIGEIDCVSSRNGKEAHTNFQTNKNVLKRITSKKLLSKGSTGRDLLLCGNKKSVGMIFIQKKVDIGISAKIGSKVTHLYPKKCHCFKCEKRAADGSCYCSHCLGIFDKSVEITPSNKEIGTQYTCYESKGTIKDVFNKHGFNKNKESNVVKADINDDIAIISKIDSGNNIFE